MSCLYYKYDVFICHASEDKKAIANPLYHHLKESGLKVWYDRDSIYAGDNIYNKIRKGLKKSLVVVLIASETSVAKNFPNMEIASIVLSPKKIGDRLIPICYKISPEDASRKIKILTLLHNLHIEDDEKTFDKNFNNVVVEIIKKVKITKKRRRKINKLIFASVVTILAFTLPWVLNKKRFVVSTKTVQTSDTIIFDTTKYNVLILPFDNPEDSYGKSRAGKELEKKIKQNKEYDSLRLDVEYLPRDNVNFTPKIAKTIGRKIKGTDMIIWGTDSKPF